MKSTLSVCTYCSDPITLDFPFKEVLLSSLPIADELVIINCDSFDTTGKKEVAQVLSEIVTVNNNIKVLKSTEDIQFVNAIHGAVLAERKNWLELGYQENDRFYNRGNIESLIVARSLIHLATHIGLMKCNGHMREW